MTRVFSRTIKLMELYNQPTSTPEDDPLHIEFDETELARWSVLPFLHSAGTERKAPDQDATIGVLGVQIPEMIIVPEGAPLL